MAYFSPEKASEDAINILNRAVAQERALSPFEIKRITRNLDSVKRSGFMVEYHTTAACFYSIIGDINNLIDCVDSVFSSSHSEPKDKLQVILALNNALRYSDIYNYLSSFDDNDFIDEPSYIDAALNAMIINFDFDSVKKIESRVSSVIKKNEDLMVSFALADAIERFYINKKCNQEYKKYIINVMDWYSENIMGRARDLLGQSSLSYNFYEDEAIDFLSISIDFRKSDIDSLLEFEDELISYIAKTDFYSEVKSSISFSLSFRDDVEDGIMKERVKIYD
ncbi:hypothetical protein [Pectobacterium aroidearum]|uniref:hypothetical protein n=1 Tax=Pectobacterium aroidearum TaxID=1201031 RepID=UPI0030173756